VIATLRKLATRKTCRSAGPLVISARPWFHGSDALPRAVGVKQRPHPSNAPTVLNTGEFNIIHWRGDRDSLEDRVPKAVTSPITSGQPDEKAIIDRLSRIADYALCLMQHSPTKRNR